MKVNYAIQNNNIHILVAELLEYRSCQDRIELQKQGSSALLSFHYKRPVQFYKDEFGKPYLLEEKDHMSISHSQEKIAIMISDKPCGVDLQYLDEKVYRVRHKFLSDEEMKNIDKGYALLMLTLCWSVKEAVYKYYGRKGLNYINDMQIRPFSWKESGTVHCELLNEEIVPVKYIYKDEYILAWTTSSGK